MMDHEYMEKNFYQHGFNPLDYMSLSGLVNEHVPIKLRCIKEHCERPAQAKDQLARMLLKLINDYHYDNWEDDYVINSIPFREFEKRGMAHEYMKYLGYDMYCVNEEGE